MRPPLQPHVPPEWDFVGLRPRASCWGVRGLLCFVWVGDNPKAGPQHPWGCPGRAPIIPLLTRRCQTDPPLFPPPGYPFVPNAGLKRHHFNEIN